MRRQTADMFGQAPWRRGVQTLAMLLLLLVGVGGQVEVHAAASGAGATGVTIVPGFLDEARLSVALAGGALGNCFLTSIRWGGIETCTTPIGLPLICIRMRNNQISNILESSGKRSHFSVMTAAAFVFINTWASADAALPTNKKIGLDSSPVDGSGSGRSNARTMYPPLASTYIQALVDNYTLDVLCQPKIIPSVGYLYFAEGDELAVGSMWRAIISPYYLNKATSGISFYAKALETSGLCKIDTNFMLCIGGWGTKYPTSGDMGASSPALRLVTTMWRAQEIHAAPMGTYGPYDMSIGFPVHATNHMPQALVAGSASLIPPFSPGSYMQWLFPGIGSAPVGHPDAWCTILGIGTGTQPQVMPQVMSEAINKTYSEEDTMSMAYWSRWTCCNWCAASNEAAGMHFVPEMGFDPVLTRIP